MLILKVNLNFFTDAIALLTHTRVPIETIVVIQTEQHGVLRRTAPHLRHLCEACRGASLKIYLMSIIFFDLLFYHNQIMFTRRYHCLIPLSGGALRDIYLLNIFQLRNKA